MSKTATKIQIITSNAYNYHGGQTFNNTYPNQLWFNTYLTDINGYDVEGYVLKIYRNNELWTTVEPNEYGTCMVYDTPVPSESIVYKVVFEGNDSYSASEKSATLSYYKGTPFINNIDVVSNRYVGEKVTIKYNVGVSSKSLENIPVKYEYIPFDKNNNELSSLKKTGTLTSNSNGIIQYAVGGTNVYSASLKFTITASENYDGFTKTFNYSWNPQVNTLLSISANDCYYPTESIITGTLTSNGSKQTGRVYFYIDDELIESKMTNSNGIVEFTNPNYPKKYPNKSNYTLKYNGTAKYAASSVSKEVGYYRNKTKIVKISTNNDVNVNEKNTLKIQLQSNEGKKLSNSTVRYSVNCYENYGVHYFLTSGSIKTDSEGYASFSHKALQQTRVEVTWTYVGSNYYDTCESIYSMNWNQIYDTFIGIMGYSVNYSEHYHDELTLSSNENAYTSLTNKKIKLYRDNVYLFDVTIGSDGFGSFTDNETTSGTHKYKAVFEGESNLHPSTYEWNVTWQKDTSATLTGRITNTGEITYNKTINLEAQYNSPVESLSGKTIKLYRATTRNPNWSYPSGNYSYLGEKTTNSNGKVTFTDTPSAPTSDDTVQKYVYVFVYEGDENHEEIIYQLDGITYLDMADSVSMYVRRGEGFSPEPYSDVLVVETYSELYEYLNGCTVKFYRDGQFLFDKTVNGSEISFTDTGAISGVHEYKAVFQRTNVFKPSTYEWTVYFEPDYSCEISARITNSSSPKYNENINFSVSLTANRMNVDNQPIHVYGATTRNKNWAYPDGKYSDLGIKYTNTNGKLTFSDKPNNPTSSDGVQKYVYVFVYEETELHPETFYQMEGITYLNNSKIELVSKNSPLEISNSSEIKIKLSDANGVLPNETVNVDVVATRADGTEYLLNESNAHRELTTNEQGIISTSYKTNIAGTYTITFSYDGTDTITKTTRSEDIIFTKKPIKIKVELDNNNLDVGQGTNFKITTLDTVTNQPIPNVNVKLRITIFDFDTKTVEIPYTQNSPLVVTTDENGEYNGEYAYSNRGDVKGNLIWFTYNDYSYQDTSTNKYVTWNKIEAEIEAKHLKHYAGCYTNIYYEEPAWNVQSPGYSYNYDNIWFKFKRKNSSYSVGYVTGQYLRVLDNNGNELLSTTTGLEGIATGRWTRNNTGTTHARVVFGGDDIFKPTSTEMEIITLARIRPTITIKYISSNGNTIRYNVPFNIEIYLGENSSTPMTNQQIRLNVNETDKGYYNTNNDGKYTLSNYNPKLIGKIPVSVRFNEEDRIDKYTSYEYTSEVNIGKDYVLLDITTGTATYTSCGDALVKFSLTDSLSRPLSDKIYIKYDDGTYSNPKWLSFDDEYVTTDSTGKYSYSVKAYSGIRLVQGIFKETTYYTGKTTVGHIKYDLNRTYTVDVTNGIVEIPVECALSSTNGIPEGLYDVKMEYIPPTTESGKCPLYGATVKTQPIRKKKGIKLEVTSNEFEKPVYEPLFVSVKASDYKNNKMIGYEITSYINDAYRSYPNHISDSNGGVSRGFASLVIGSENKYSFIFNQTREYAGCRLDVDTTTLKRKPTLEVPASISGYTSLPIEMKSTHYFFHDTYNRYGQIVKKDSSGNFVYHNPLAKNSTAYNEYYYVKNDAEIKCDKTYYDNAEPNSSKIWIQNKKIIWKNKDKTKTLTSAPTMNNGVSTALYTSNTALNEKVYAISEEDNIYLSCEAQSNLNIIQRTEAWFADINFDEKDSNGRYVRHGVYNQEYILFTYLYLDKNKHVEEGEKVIFKQGNAKIGEGTTDSNGRATLTIKCTTPTLYPYTVEFKGHDQYTDATKSYKVHIEKQTPLLTLNISNTNPNVGDKITLKATFTESEAAGKKPLKSTGLLFKDGDENILWQRTDDKGVATITYVTKHGGQRTFYVGYEDENNVRYNKVSKTQQITIKKIATSIECKEGNPYEIPGDSTYKLTFTLKDSNKNTLIGKKITVNYNGTSKEYTTNNYGQVSVDSGTYVQGTTKNMVLSFGGDDNYASSTLTENLTWGQPLNREDCSNLDNFDIIYENWYASDGSSKWGLDVEGLNLLDGQAANNNDKYKNQCTPILGTNYKLRTVCNKLVTTRSELEDLFDKENKIVAPTGVAVRSKRIKTTNKCTIKFYFKINYDKSNESYNGGASNYLMAGHFGLLEGGNITTAEKAPVRLEFYRGNAYMISEGGKAMYSNLRYKLFLPSTEYLVDLDVDGNKITVTFYNNKNERVSEPQTWTMSKSLENLHPYAFAYTNGTALVLREIEIIKK